MSLRAPKGEAISVSAMTIDDAIVLARQRRLCLVAPGHSLFESRQGGLDVERLGHVLHYRLLGFETVAGNEGDGQLVGVDGAGADKLAQPGDGNAACSLGEDTLVLRQKLDALHHFLVGYGGGTAL